MSAKNPDMEGEAPPAYSEVSPASSIQRFPSELSLYFPAGDFYLAERLAQPLYYVRVNYLSITPIDAEIILGTGPDPQLPPYATLRLRAGSDVRVWAPKLSELDLSAASVVYSGPGGPLGLGFGHCNFTVRAGSRVEDFEWKRSLVGWKLLRRPPPPEAAEASTSSPGARDYETVATFTTNSHSRSKIVTIRFENSGATGELGDSWAVLTILSGLSMHFHKPGSLSVVADGKDNGGGA